MKKIALLVLVLFCGTSNAQKKKKSTTNPIVAVIITKTENLTAEVIKPNFYIFRNENSIKKDTLLLKAFSSSITPTDCVIKKFVTKSTPLYYVSWTEKMNSETKLKKETIVVTNVQIWNPATKMQVFSNTQTSTNIKEQVFLDKNKTASETQERNRNEGYNFTLLPTGDFTLKNKAVESKYNLNTVTMKYELPQKSADVSKSSKKKKK
ncbi:hypothetical protein [Flavobacterium sp.]|uniref:hypothetical protein n=1 Tax=Flavobacterium sp. TaxID=239 RepID=UPI00286DE23C|nr:hypothetical protein [Flavobacterium sp.]